MNLEIKLSTQGNKSIVYLIGEVDVYTAPQLKSQLFPLVEQNEHKIIVDLAQVEFMDSSGLGTIIGALKTAKNHNSEITLQHANERLQRLFSITGLSALVEINGVQEGQS
ncbi:STAS domain-containing protein [Bacillus horti]|uniref:Anti-sigma factor antagonist n=1 Tax=Caldalkalibacillus horti TaxID=77523 RepID=A0ABT9W4T6_9BACI|nr:STAS domain-containing protein [Bacillus horti]MDQ0168262.1 anti-sigma B factor antagonist [Bacillus horti]